MIFQKAITVLSSLKGEGNKLEVIQDSVVVSTFYFTPICEPQYTVHQCDFINKYGQWQRLSFFKASKTTLMVEGSTAMMMAGAPNFSSYGHKTKDFNRQGHKSIELNTGWVTDAYSEVIEQIAMSEIVLIDDLPVNLDTKSIEMLEGINVGNINYRLTFKYATPVINQNT